jgi:hypothetical protein
MNRAILQALSTKQVYVVANLRQAEYLRYFCVVLAPLKQSVSQVRCACDVNNLYFGA